MKISYEKTTCSRCGGSGHYSFNPKDGTRCYGCGGSGQKLSANGKRAKARIRAFMAERYNVRADSVEPGTDVRIDGTWTKINAVSMPIAMRIDGRPLVTLSLSKGVGMFRAKQYNVAPETLLQLHPGPEKFRSEVVPFARRFKGAIVSE